MYFFNWLKYFPLFPQKLSHNFKKFSKVKKVYKTFIKFANANKNAKATVSKLQPSVRSPNFKYIHTL